MGGGTVIHSTSSLTSNKNSGTTSIQNSRQKTMEYLQQVPDSLSMDHTYSLLQEMELMGEDEEDEDIVNDVAEEEDLEIENNEEVIFSPQTHKTLTIDFVKVNLILAKQKWGPVQAMRKSARVDVGDRTMLEIAVNTKKVQNLETNKKEIDPLNPKRTKVSFLKNFCQEI